MEEVEIEEVAIEKGIVAASKIIHAHLSFGNYAAAKMVYQDLKWFLAELPHDEMVALVNQTGVASKSAGWIVKAWCDLHEIKNPIIEFETAWCIGGPGETMTYRQGKKTWGDLVSIQKDEHAAQRAARRGEVSLRMAFHLKENNPIRLKQTTRNELKLILGSSAVANAMRSKKEEFIADLGPTEANRVERITGMPVGKIWSSIKSGSQELVDRLGMIPSRKREQMRKSGMFVADHVDPQLDLVESGPTVQLKKRGQVRRAAAGKVDQPVPHPSLF